MKSFRIFAATLCGLFTFAACSDLGDIKERLDSLESRVTALEKIIPALNENVAALQTLANGATIVEFDLKDGVYTLTLSNGETIKLNQGSTGIGVAPVVGIDSDGYWTVDYKDGEGPKRILKDGEPVKAVGENGLTPIFGVDAQGYWTVKYTADGTPERVLDENGQPVKATAASGGDSYFQSVSYENGEFVIVLNGSTEPLRIPVVSNFYFRFIAPDGVEPNEEGCYEIVYSNKLTFTVESKGVAEYALLSKPEGFEVSLSETALEITAPAASTKASTDSKTDVSILAVSTDGLSCIAKVRVVAVNPPKPVYATWYEEWENGSSISIGGVEFSKATFEGDTYHITAESTEKGLKKDGIWFVDEDVTATLDSKKNVIVIGNTKGKRSKVTRENYAFIAATDAQDYWVMYNIDFDLKTTGTYMFQVNGDNLAELICIDNCSLAVEFSDLSKSNNLIYASAKNTVGGISICNSEFIFQAGSTANFINMGATQTIPVVNIDNNVFYTADPEDGQTTTTILIAAGNTTVNDFKINRNTFYGAYPAGNMTNCKTGMVEVKGNMFGLASSVSANIYVIGGSIASSMDITGNAYYKNGDTDKSLFSVSNSNKAPAGKLDNPKSVGISTAGWNPAEGKFTIHAEYGATR